MHLKLVVCHVLMHSTYIKALCKVLTRTSREVNYSYLILKTHLRKDPNVDGEIARTRVWIIPEGSAKTNPFPNTEKTIWKTLKRGKTLRARTNTLRLAQTSPFFLCGKLLKTQACDCAHKRKHTSWCKCCVSLAWIKAMRNGLSKQAPGSDSMEQLERKSNFCVYSQSGTNS